MKHGHKQDKMGTVLILSMQFLLKVQNYIPLHYSYDAIITVFLADIQEMWKPIWSSSFLILS